jgi:hypothetical protein
VRGIISFSVLDAAKALLKQKDYRESKSTLAIKYGHKKSGISPASIFRSKQNWAEPSGVQDLPSKL